MNKKFLLSIVTVSAIMLTGCASKMQKQYYQADVSEITDEPEMIVRPFSRTARTWFDTDKSDLKPEGMAELDMLAKELQTAKSQGLITESNKLVILGHADSRASQAYNQKLSERRTVAVAKYLSSKGIPSSGMLAVGKGETRPVASNRSASGRQQNRRVEVHIKGPAINVVYF